jgi:hypothetical protein
MFLQLKRKEFAHSLIDQLFYKSEKDMIELERSLLKSLEKEAKLPILDVDEFNGKPIMKLDEWQKDYEIRKNMILNGGEKPPLVYNYYNIFEGKAEFSLNNGNGSKEAPGTRILSCLPINTLKKFSAIPDGICLSTKIGVSEFHRYIEKAILNDHYLVIPAFTFFPSKIEEQAFRYFKNNQLVGSVQFSQSCKLFVFCKNHIKPEWLKAIDFFYAVDNFDEVEPKVAEGNNDKTATGLEDVDKVQKKLKTDTLNNLYSSGVAEDQDINTPTKEYAGMKDTEILNDFKKVQKLGLSPYAIPKQKEKKEPARKPTIIALLVLKTSEIGEHNNIQPTNFAAETLMDPK